MSIAHLHVLMMLEVEGSLSMGRLAEALDVSLPSATGLITRMEERGLVRRVRDGVDRRVVLVELTGAGRDATDELEIVRHRQLRRLVEAMTPAEQATCLEALHVVAGTMRRLGIEQDHGTGIGCPILKSMKETGSR